MKLDEIRENISSIDEEIIILLSKRLNFAKDIIIEKKKIGLTAKQPEMEAKLLEKYVKKANLLKIRPDFIINLYTLIFEEMVRIQLKNNHKEKECN